MGSQALTKGHIPVYFGVPNGVHLYYHILTKRALCMWDSVRKCHSWLEFFPLLNRSRIAYITLHVIVLHIFFV